MSEWEDYYLKDNPFKDVAYIAVESDDERLNGKIFSQKGFEAPYKRAIAFLERKRPILYIRADESERGTGKSSMMAALYLHFMEKETKNFSPIWVSVHDFRTINQLMGRIVETFVFSGIPDEIKNHLGDVRYDKVDTLLKQSGKNQRLPSEVAALTKILELPSNELAWKYMNIRRSYPQLGSIELFADILMMYHRVNKIHLITFIDQFEEYVEYQAGQALTQLGQDVKDLYRAIGAAENLTFVLSMHPRTQSKFEARAREILATYGEIMDNAVTVGELNDSDLIEIAELYIRKYRTKKQPEKYLETFPFTPKALDYIVAHSKSNPRVMIRLLSNALNEARFTNKKVVNTEFLQDTETHQMIGLGAEVKTD